MEKCRSHQIESGTWITDPDRIDIRGALSCGRDVRIDVGCVFEGAVTLGEGVNIGPYCVLRDVAVGASTEIMPYSHLTDATIGANCRIGPFARLRPGAELDDDVHIGNFVEVKASVLGHGAKANHLAYIGDTTVGRDVNFGAGSITANYDGANKHRTVIGDNVHVGSNCVLVAPLEIGAGATIGGGSTIVNGAPGEALTLARGDHRNGKSAVELRDGHPDRRQQIVGGLAMPVRMDQMRDDFGIGLRAKHVAARLQTLAQRFIVLDDAIVNNRDLVTRQMRMRVVRRGCAMRRPARMRNAAQSMELERIGLRCKVRDTRG